MGWATSGLVGCSLLLCHTSVASMSRSRACFSSMVPDLRKGVMHMSYAGVSRLDLLKSSSVAALGLATSTIVTGGLIPAIGRPEGVNRPDLLPKGDVTNVIDLTKFLTSGQRKRLDAQLAKLEKDTGIKLRVLCQRYPDTPGLAIKDYWNIDDKTIILVADKGPSDSKQLVTRNLLNFNVGAGLSVGLPNVFWNRLRSKYGSLFFVREQGEDQAILSAVNVIDDCIRAGGCVDLPKGMEGTDEGGIFGFMK